MLETAVTLKGRLIVVTSLTHFPFRFPPSGTGYKNAKASATTLQHPITDTELAIFKTDSSKGYTNRMLKQNDGFYES
jgi:hypothetical protein